MGCLSATYPLGLVDASRLTVATCAEQPCSRMREFEEDVHKHIHLVNNILFARAVAL